jgi:hypothetical protein
MQKVILTFISVLLISYNFGCTKVANSSSGMFTPQPTSLKQQASTPDFVDDIEKIQFKKEDSSNLFVLKEKASSANLVDANNKNIAIIKTEDSGKIKLRNFSDKTLGYVVFEKENWKLENSDNKELYTFRKQGKKDYKLEDWTNREIYRIKKRDYGFDILKANKKLLYKVEVKEGKTSLRDIDDKTIFSTTSELPAIAFACFGLDALTREQQAALAYAVKLTEGK